ncbi:MAG: bifunctional riboflavin kinase/FAD synthetase [Candidatus Limnocylindrales bacterium]
MRVLRSIEELPADMRFALTIGMFDGVHRGHQRAIATLVRTARRARAEAVVLTFDPHPAQVLRGSAPPLLSAPAERIGRLARLGVDTTVVQRFDAAFADQTPDAFLQRICARRRLVALVMTGESAFGRDRAGVLDRIRQLAGEMSFRAVEVARLTADGGTISSTRLRRKLADGRLAEVRRLLGRRYAVIGRVVAGERRGRTLGYPTANLAFDAPVALPPDGVYAVRVTWGGSDPLEPTRAADGVASLGVRPTFGGGERLLEVHLFDVDDDLYSQDVRVEFVRRLRGEKNFSSADALVDQMDRDAARAKSVLASA